MIQRNRFPHEPMTAKVKTYGFMLFFMLILMLSGCGSSDFNNALGDDESGQDTKTSDTTVREHWKTISEVNVMPHFVTFTTTPSDAENKKTDILKGKTDSISVALSLISNTENKISGSGSIRLADDVSSTKNPMVLGFESGDVNITADSLNVSGSGYLTTKLKNGSTVQPLCEYSLAVTRSGSDFSADVTLRIKDFETVATFCVPIFRTSDNNGPLSFISQTWSKQSPGIQVHFPRKRYASQKVSAGISENTLLTFTFGATPDTTDVKGLLSIPSNLSGNGDDIRIGIDTQAYIFEQKLVPPPTPTSETSSSKDEAPVYINEGQHTVIFQQSGITTTHDTSGRDIDTDYSLSVSVTAKNVFMTSPNPAYPSTDPEKPVPAIRVDGYRTEYTALVSLILKDLKNDSGQSGEQEVTLRTTLRSEIKRTDPNAVVYDSKGKLVIPSFSNGTFILEGGREYHLSHATSITDITRETVDGIETLTASGDTTQDVVKTTAGHVQLDFTISGTGDHLAVQEGGRLFLDKEACPAGSPGLSVNLAGLPVERTVNGEITTLTIGKTVPVPVSIVKHHWFGTNCPQVKGFLTLTLRPNDDGAVECHVSLTSPDLVTSVDFTAAIVCTSTSDQGSTSTWTLSKNMNHTVYSVVNGMIEANEIADQNILMNVVLGYRVNRGVISVKASGSMFLDLGFMKGDLIFEDCDISVAENGKDIVIEGLLKYRNGSSLTGDVTLNIELITNDSGDKALSVSFMLTDSDGNPLRLVSFSVDGEKTAESADVLSALLKS